MVSRSSPWDTGAVLGLEALLFVMLLWIPNQPVLLFLGSSILLGLPGYLATLLLFPARSRLDGVTRLILSGAVTTGLIIALSVLFLVLRLPFVPVSVVELLLLLSFGLAFGAELRRRRLRPEERFVPRLPRLRLPQITRVESLGVLAIAGMLVVSAYALFVVASRPPSGTYTTLFLLNGEGGAGNYPQDVTVGNVSRIIVGVTSREDNIRSYQLVVGLFNATGGGLTGTIYQPSLSNEIQGFVPGRAFAINITLAPSETWQETMDFTIQTPGTFRLRFLLLTDTGAIYRENFLWVNATA